MPDDRSPLIPALQGLRIELLGPTTRPAAPAATQSAQLKQGVDIDVDFLRGRPDLTRSLEARIGKPLSFADLNDITAQLVSESRAAGRPVIDVVLPEQDITDGVVRIVVIEGRVGQVRVEGERRQIIAERLAGQVRLRHGDPIDSDILLADIDWINRRSPFRNVEPIFEKGKGPGETDVVLRSAGAKYPLRLYTSFDNTGSESTGEERLAFGFNWGDAFFLGQDHQLGYQYSTDAEGRRFQAHGITYSVPLASRHIASLSGTWSRTDPDFADARINSSGESWQISGRYEIPLRRRATSLGSLRHHLTFGADVKRTNNDLEFGGQSVFDRAAETVQFSATYAFTLSADTGNTSGDVKLVVSPGYLTSANNGTAYEEARPGAEPRYAYLAGSIERSWNLPKGFDLTARGSAQLGTGALLSAEQIGLAGSDSVRGYSERAINADAGLLASFEVRSPSISLLDLAKINGEDDLRFYVFLDAGTGWNFQGGDANPSAVHAMSIGPGVRYRLGSYGTLDASYGFRLSDNGIVDDESGRGHLAVSASLQW